MAEFDFTGMVEALEGAEGVEGDGLFAELEEASSSKEAKTKFNDWKKSGAAKSFRESFFDSFTDIEKGEKGGWDIKKENGEKFNTKELKEKMTGDYGDNIKSPDYRGAFKDLGVPEDELNSEDFKTFSEKIKTEFKESKTAQDCEGVNNSTQIGNDINSDVGGEPESKEDFEEKAKKTGRWKKFTDTTEKIKKGGFKLGKWVAYAGAVGIGVELYEAIKDHQNAMNGCWYIKTADGSKCKVWPLTCNKDDRVDKGAPKCTMCTNIKQCNDLKFNPSIASASPKKSELDFPGKYNEEKDPENTCANSTYCATTQTCKNEADCSEFCDVSKFNLPVGYTLKCVSVDFWGAANDLIPGGIFNFGEELLKKILKILIYVVIIIIVLFFIFFIAKFLLSRLFKNKDEK